ncbi:MAG: protein kinase domain-containing protein [Bryobacteraceae bacterium]
MSDPQGATGPQAAALKQGDTFAGRYEILAHVGAGGMAVVYKANDALAREVIALKIITTSAARDPRLLGRFQQELLLARRMSHPNVVRIHDIGEHAGQMFISMEFVDGTTVAAEIAEKGCIAPSAFFPIFEQFCAALAYIHSRQVIHRDIKPLNVMIDRAGAVKLMDFGIARDQSGDATQGLAMGTPAYMAPELLTAGAPSAATDIYAAGVMFYEMLTGHKPLLGQASQLRILCPHITPALSRLIEKCLELEPSKRFQSVDELRAAGAGVDGCMRVAGGSLTEFRREEPAAIEAALPLFVQTIQAVLAIRAARRHHVALTPANIRVAGDGRVEILSDAAPQLEATVAIEPKYTAPEMFQAGKQDSAAGGVYALGFIFYEMLAGAKLFGDQFTQIGESNADLGWLTWHADPNLRVQPLRNIVPEFPQLLSDTIERMIEKQATARTITLEEALHAFQRLSPELTQPVQPVAQGRTPSPQPPKGGKHWLWAAIGGLAAVILLVVSIRAFRPNEAPEPPPSRREEPAPPPAPPLPPVLNTSTGEMVLIPEGEFLMGSEKGAPNEAPAHRVALAAFYIDRIEVTNASYKLFCDSTGRRFPADRYFSQETFPIVNVSWDEAAAFAEWAGKRLPSEAEWEKAARGSDGRLYPWGNEPRKLPEDVAGAGTFAADRSPFGIFDMAANAAEWVAGEYKFYAGNPATVPRDQAGYRVVRGPGLFARTATLTTRVPHAPQLLQLKQYARIGFRCAVSRDEARKFQSTR